MFKVSFECRDIKALDEHIKFVKRMANMKHDQHFKKFIQDKCMDALETVMNERLSGGTTNDDQINLYRRSNHLKEEADGFIIYNDTKIPTSDSISENYPNGMFSIALAFEYGVGIIGENTNNPNAWEYNVNDYNFGWFFKDSDGKVKQTGGYIGFEIYRYTAERIQNNLNKWVNEYYKREV